jgi:hypothetical protein
VVAAVLKEWAVSGAQPIIPLFQPIDRQHRQKHVGS